ncbi:MAG: N-acetyl-alpha-D-glucosaminyl L-malate synthase BshA, partial [Chloroflexi bacterium]|nr:N-acetyl-alpha-D-glucosaminyl L-malate synthase BshA [Chloroflexota bacterium]
PTHGGSGVVATELGKMLAAQGHEVAFVSYSAPLRLAEVPERVSFHQVDAIQYPLFQSYPNDLALASKIVAVARMKQLQLLHVHYAIPFAPAALMAKYAAPELNLKVVTTLHGTDITLVGSDPTFRPITRWAIQESDAVTAVSHWLRQEAIREFEIDRPIEVVHNFIDTNRHSAPCPGCIPPLTCAGEVTLLHISNFRPVKRVEDVVRVFARVRARMQARLLMVGDGPTASLAMQTAVELGVADRVHFIGVVEQIEPIIQQANLLLLPSATESFGLVALEAMASGVPVIASDAGGIPEVVIHGKTGYLAPVGDVESMAAHAIALLEDTELYSQVSQNAHEWAAQHFDSRVQVARYEQVYRRALGLDQDQPVHDRLAAASQPSAADHR